MKNDDECIISIISIDEGFNDLKKLPNPSYIFGQLKENTRCFNLDLKNKRNILFPNMVVKLKKVKDASTTQGIRDNVWSLSAVKRLGKWHNYET